MNIGGQQTDQTDWLATQLVLSRLAWAGTMAVMEIDFPEDLLEPFQALARRRGMTPSELLIEICDEEMARLGGSDDPPSQPVESLLDLRGSVRWNGDLKQSREGRQ